MKITLKYFFSEICNFRKLMGDLTFWEKTKEQRQKAIDGLTYVYLNLTQDDGKALSSSDIEMAANILDSTLTEYTQREGMILFRSPLTPTTE